MQKLDLSVVLLSDKHIDGSTTFTKTFSNKTVLLYVDVRLICIFFENVDQKPISITKTRLFKCIENFTSKN